MYKPVTAHVTLRNKVLGRSYLPWLFTNSGDKKNVVILDKVVFKSDEEYKKHLITHEVGHWLGLEHIWGSTLSSCNDAGDDFNSYINFLPTIDSDINVEYIQNVYNDTPNSNEDHFGKCQDNDDDSCFNNFAMYDNFMDYSTCPLAFTNGQVKFMNDVLKFPMFGRIDVYKRSNLESTFVCVPPTYCDINTSKSKTKIQLSSPDYADNTVHYRYKIDGAAYSFIDIPGDYTGSDIVDININWCKKVVIEMIVECNGKLSEPVYKYLGGCQVGGSGGIVTISFRDVNIYPNPSNGKVKVDVLDFDEVDHYYVSSITGNQVMLEYNNLNSFNGFEINTTSLKKGYYILTVVFDDGTKSSEKLIVN